MHEQTQFLADVYGAFFRVIEEHQYGPFLVREVTNRWFMKDDPARITDIELIRPDGIVFSLSEHWLPEHLKLYRYRADNRIRTWSFFGRKRSRVARNVAGMRYGGRFGSAVQYSQERIALGSWFGPGQPEREVFWQAGAMLELAHEIAHFLIHCDVLSRRESRKSRRVRVRAAKWSRKGRGPLRPEDARHYAELVLTDERRAWAIALLMIRRAREAGFDPEPQMSRLDLMRFVHLNLLTYEAGVDQAMNVERAKEKWENGRLAAEGGPEAVRRLMRQALIPKRFLKETKI